MLQGVRQPLASAQALARCGLTPPRRRVSGYGRPGATDMRRAARIERLIWVFVYAGLFAVGLGVAVRSSVDGLPWLLIGGGAVSVLIGALLLWVRSRMRDDA